MWVALLGFTAVSCSAPEDTTVKFDARNYQAGELSLGWIDPAGEFAGAKVQIVDGRGEWVTDLPEGTQVSLYNLDKRNLIELGGGVIPGPSIWFFVERGTIRISFDAEQWPEATIKGGKISSDVNRYWALTAADERASFEDTRRKVEAGEWGKPGNDDDEDDGSASRAVRMRDARIGFMQANPDSPVSFSIYKSMKYTWTYDEQLRYFQALGQGLRESDEGVRIAGDLETMRTLMPGNPAPLFSKTDKDGRMVSLGDYRGKHVLIDFWGTWCGPCRDSHPHLVELYEKYGPLGVEFINVALESGNGWRDKWLSVIEEDGLVWTNIADNENPDEGNIVEMYQINAFPTKFLIGPDGAIIGNSHEMDIDAKLAEIFGR